jgi:hypothetical protein
MSSKLALAPDRVKAFLGRRYSNFQALRAWLLLFVDAYPEWQQSAKRLVDILIAGSRPIQ